MVYLALLNRSRCFNYVGAYQFDGYRVLDNVVVFVAMFGHLVIFVSIRRVPVEREIINVYDVFEI